MLFRSGFTAAVMALVHRKAEAGNTSQVRALEEAAPTGRGAEIIDLAELLQRSLKGGNAGNKAKGEATAASKAKPATNATPKRRQA